MHDRLRPPLAAAVALALGLVVTACASESKPAPAPAPEASASASPSASPSATATPTAAMPNACPADGCRVSIVAVRDAGDELTLDLQANFAPDISHNHFHVYWDRFTAEQVSDDAAPRFKVTQGDWVPTADQTFTTADAASVAKRENSARICVTAGDRDHNVIDPTLFQCHDAPGTE